MNEARVWPRQLFRVVISISALLLILQPIYAGRFLSGEFDALQAHRHNATYAGISVAVALLSAVLLRWPGRGPWWPIAACAGLFGLIVAQIALGFGRVLTLHIPLGVSIIALVVLLTVWAWRSR